MGSAAEKNEEFANLDARGSVMMQYFAQIDSLKIIEAPSMTQR
jgi:hypothetical protein